VVVKIRIKTVVRLNQEDKS